MDKYLRTIMKRTLLFISSLLSISLCEPFFCSRYKQQRCLVDCKWNKVTKECENCQVGYFGQNCSMPCRYPNFGRDCQKVCSQCDEKECSPIYGCTTNVPSEIIKVTSSSSVIHRNSVERSDSFGLDPVIIGTLTSSGFLLVFISFAVVTVFNRRRFIRNISRRAHFIDSVITDIPADFTQRSLTNDSLLHYSRN